MTVESVYHLYKILKARHLFRTSPTLTSTSTSKPTTFIFSLSIHFRQTLLFCIVVLQLFNF